MKPSQKKEDWDCLGTFNVYQRRDAHWLWHGWWIGYHQTERGNGVDKNTLGVEEDLPWWPEDGHFLGWTRDSCSQSYQMAWTSTCCLMCEAALEELSLSKIRAIVWFHWWFVSLSWQGQGFKNHFDQFFVHAMIGMFAKKLLLQFWH